MIVLVGTGGLVGRIAHDSIDLQRVFTLGDHQWARLSFDEVHELATLVEAEVTRRAALAEQERIKAEAQAAATQEAIDRMDDESLTARCALEAARRGWTE